MRNVVQLYRDLPESHRLIICLSPRLVVTDKKITIFCSASSNNIVFFFQFWFTDSLRVNRAYLMRTKSNQLFLPQKHLFTFLPPPPPHFNNYNAIHLKPVKPVKILKIVHDLIMGPVHAYPYSSENATFSFRLPSTRI